MASEDFPTDWHIGPHDWTTRMIDSTFGKGGLFHASKRETNEETRVLRRPQMAYNNTETRNIGRIFPNLDSAHEAHSVRKRNRYVTSTDSSAQSFDNAIRH